MKSLEEHLQEREAAATAYSEAMTDGLACPENIGTKLCGGTAMVVADESTVDTDVLRAAIQKAEAALAPDESLDAIYDLNSCNSKEALDELLDRIALSSEMGCRNIVLRVETPTAETPIKQHYPWVPVAR